MRQLHIRALTMLTAGALVIPGAAVLLTASPSEAADPPPLSNARAASPVILTGAQLGTWSGPSAAGVANPYPSGSNQGGDFVRSGHNGTMTVVPPATGINPDTLAAYSWVNGAWKEVPVQVDQKFPYFLANGHSSFAFYSGTDEELTYAWNPGPHATGEEAWKKVFGNCTARYANAGENAALPNVGSRANANKESAASGDLVGYTGPMQDPVPTLDSDDEVVFMASDASGAPPANTAPPAGTTAAQSVQVLDPLNPADVRYVYLFLKPTGSSFNAANGYVTMTRDADADAYMDADSFLASDPEKLGSENLDYGPNITGTVCKNVTGTAPVPRLSTAEGVKDPAGDRFPSDAMTVSTPTYELRATGRWMVRSMRVTRPGVQRQYGP
ncbi:MAG: hypothetical protein QOE05_1952, partial [Actinomycetota bacterium]|nr:hypothetical protein [Actinomycetota bacterium]